MGPRSSQDLRSPSPIMAPDKTLNFKAWQQKPMENITENVKIICLQITIWKVSCNQSIVSGLLCSFNLEWQGFSIVCSENE